MNPWPWLAGGLALGAVPASVMEVLQPAWTPAVVTAFLLPMLASGAGALLIWGIIDTRRRWPREDNAREG